MSCCPVRACRALLIEHKYVLFEATVCCLSIAQCALILKREPRFVLYARPCGRTVLKFRLRWSATGGIDRWVLAGGIDLFPIVAPDHADSLGFVVRISLRANPDDRVVIDGVPIGGRARPLIGFIVAGCLTVA
jgi:hypothetical protein